MPAWVPVFKGGRQEVSLLASFLQGDAIPCRITPDVKSLPLHSPGAHHVKSAYQRHVLLVQEDHAERARELINYYEEEEGAG